MTNKLKSRKLKLIITGVALLVAIVGTTYAWWTASYETKETVSMGNLKIAGDFAKLTELTNYEPGTTAEMAGHIQNTGSIPTIIKIENNTNVQFAYKNDELEAIPENEQEFIKDPNEMIRLTFGPESGNYEDENVQAFWFTDQQNQLYVILDPGETLAVTNSVEFAGDMGNQYQDARIQVGALLRATQVMEGAIQKEFNLSADELIPMENPSTRAAGNNRAASYLAELLKR